MMLPVLFSAPRTFATSSTFISWSPISSTRSRRCASHSERMRMNIASSNAYEWMVKKMVMFRSQNSLTS